MSIPWNKLSRYVAGDLPVDEARALEQWISGSPERQQLAADLRLLWSEAGSLRQEFDAEAAIARIKTRPLAGATPTPRFALLQNADNGSWFKIAAMLVIGLGIGLLWPKVNGSFRDAATARVVVPAGSQAIAELPGGVRVQLSYASELTYSPSDDVREIHLSGEAYITVPNGQKRNLLVHTQAGTIRDLGTEFTVRARGVKTSVVVTAGKVRLETPHGDVTLDAGQSTAVQLGRAPAPASPADLDAALDWMSGRLTFYDTSLSEVVEELEYRYGAEFRIMAPELRSTRITAKISGDATAANAVEVICIAIQASCKRAGARWLIARP